MDHKDLQSFIRNHGFAWPGGYPCALLMADGECIDSQAARENYRQIRRNMDPATRTAEDWTPAEVFIHWEGDSLYCAHSNREIPSAYGPVEDLKGNVMFHPAILSQLTYRYRQQRMPLVDACTDTAQFFDVSFAALIAFAETYGI